MRVESRASASSAAGRTSSPESPSKAFEAGLSPPATPAHRSCKKPRSPAPALRLARLWGAPPCSTPPPRPGLRFGTHRHHLTDCVLANGRGPSRRSDAARRAFPTAATTMTNEDEVMEKKSSETVGTRTEPRADMNVDASRINFFATRVGSVLKRVPKAVAAAGPPGAIRTQRSEPGAPSTRSRTAGIPLGSRRAMVFFAAIVAPSARRPRAVVPPSDEDVGGWNASKATTTSIMFWSAAASDADIDDWDISSFADVPSSFLRRRSHAAAARPGTTPSRKSCSCAAGELRTWPWPRARGPPPGASARGSGPSPRRGSRGGGG